MKSMHPWPRLAAMALLAALISGCAGLNTLSTEVSTYGEWPADRKPGSYAFERLPSQQALGAESDALEAAAATALAKAGFTPAAPGQSPDVVVQVGSRSWRTVDRRWDDRLWWSAGVGYGWRGPWGSPRWSLAWHGDYPPRYEREVGLLLRDRSSGKPLYEARASSEGNSAGGSSIRGALFDAALQDFPKLGLNPRRIVVTLPDRS